MNGIDYYVRGVYFRVEVIREGEGYKIGKDHMKRVFKLYRGVGDYHRIDGPAIEYIGKEDEGKVTSFLKKAKDFIVNLGDTGKDGEFEDLYDEEVGMNLDQWAVNNKGFPGWVPKVKDGKIVSGVLNKKTVFDVIFKFDREYGLYLNGIYDKQYGEKKAARDILREAIMKIIGEGMEINDLIGIIIKSLGRVIMANDMLMIERSIEEEVYSMKIDGILVVEGTFIKAEAVKEEKVE